MPLPDTNNWSSRIYELLKETDLENLSYAQFQGVAEKLFIEPENEDELRRLVLVQLARMAVRGDWDGFLGGGGVTDADYLLAFDQGTIPSGLTNARKLVVGNNISMAHGAGANDDMSISAVPGGSDGQIQYNVAGVLSATGLLSTNKTNELTLVAISGDGQINISSSTKAVSLLCDVNQKLKVKGATDTFVFDVSSSSGGITFPDGTTQTSAASGGASGVQYTPAGLGSSVTAYAWHSISNQTPFVFDNFDGESENFWVGGPRYWPFIAPEDGDISDVKIRISSGQAGTNLLMGVYSDAGGYPGAQIANMSVSAAASGYVETSTISGSKTVVKGQQYWFGQVLDTAPTTFVGWGHKQANCGRLIPTNGTTNTSIALAAANATSLPTSAPVITAGTSEARMYTLMKIS